MSDNSDTVPVTIACVLKSGGEFKPAHVTALRRMVGDHVGDEPYRFVCLTDAQVGSDCETIPLVDNLPGWWSKIELFKIHGPLLYLDLDTVVVGDLSPVIRAVPSINFGILRDFYRGRLNPSAMGSGVMCWSGDKSEVAKRFHHNMMKSMHGGDQIFLEGVVKDPSFFQDMFPGSFLSFKANRLHSVDVPEDARVICFHGRPRPWQQNRIPYQC